MIFAAGKLFFCVSNVTRCAADATPWEHQRAGLCPPRLQQPFPTDRGKRNHPGRRFGRRRQRILFRNHHRQPRKRLFQRAACVYPRLQHAGLSAQCQLQLTDGVLQRAAAGHPLQQAEHKVAEQRQTNQQQRRHIKVDHAVFDKQTAGRKKIPDCHQNTGKRKAQQKERKHLPKKRAASLKPKCGQCNRQAKAQLHQEIDRWRKWRQQDDQRADCPNQRTQKQPASVHGHVQKFGHKQQQQIINQQVDRDQHIHVHRLQKNHPLANQYSQPKAGILSKSVQRQNKSAPLSRQKNPQERQRPSRGFRV